MPARAGLFAFLFLSLAAGAGARSFRVTLLGSTHVITCGDRVLGREGRPPFVPVPRMARPPPPTPIPAPGDDPRPTLFVRLSRPDHRARLFAVVPSDPRTAGPFNAAYETWMQTRYGLPEGTQHASHAAIWPYFREERPSPAINLAGGAGEFELALKTSNAVTNYVVATRAVLQTSGGPHPDWSRIREDYVGTATVWNVGINRREQPGGMTRGDAPQGLVANINNRYQSGFFYADTALGPGWISLYWLEFP